MTDAGWFEWNGPRRNPRTILVLGPAGGDIHHFAKWTTGLPKGWTWVGVRLPGRGARVGHPTLPNLPAVVRALARAVVQEEVTPAAVFGHGFGSLVALRLLEHLYPGTQEAPVLVVGGDADPSAVPTQETATTASDDALLQQAVTEGLVPAVVWTLPDVRRVVEAQMRTDHRWQASDRVPPVGARFRGPWIRVSEADSSSQPEPWSKYLGYPAVHQIVAPGPFHQEAYATHIARALQNR